MRQTIMLTLLLCLATSFSPGQRAGGGEANSSLKTNQASLAKWKAMRFGMFIHWGPVTLRGTEIGWSRGPQVSIGDYDNLYREFNPVLFNAGEWVAAAKAAGMKYLVITSKHHDGFCLWDSKYTDYDILSTPFRRDVLKELSEECRRQGVMFCTYYSILDWHHPDYTTRYGGDPRPLETSDMNRYRTYLKNQVGELITTYHTNLLWFDGQWENSWTHENGMDLYAYARRLNNDLLINNRVDKGGGTKGMTKSDQYAGDFGTPEQEIGLFNNEDPWESCITICQQWSWKPNDRLKSLKECIQLLAKSAFGGGNLLLNISPMPDGRIEARQMDRLKGIGRWLERHGESIYGTSGGPLKPTTWLGSTCKGNSIYVHLLTAPANELRLPAIPGRKVTAVRLLGGPALQFSSNNNQVVVRLPAPQTLDENDAVIALDINGPADGIAPLEVPPNAFSGTDGVELSLKNAPGQSYEANGPRSLVDGLRGSNEFRDGKWMGFERDDLEAVFDLRTARPITRVSVGCLQTQGSWIFFPKSVEVAVSDDGAAYRPVGRMESGEPKRDSTVLRKDFVVPLERVTARYVKIRAANVGVCPAWHSGGGEKAWLFVDEIRIE
jgi:alpha-L-fucosidase